MAVSKRLRYEVLRRDNYTCRYCGASAPEVKLTVDHVTPVALGGSDEPTNLVSACGPCNFGKSSSSPDAPLVEDVAQDALRFVRALALVADRRTEEREYRERLLLEISNDWFTYTRNGPLPDNWEYTIVSLHTAGLCYFDMEELIKMTAKTPLVKDQWRYFCGCAWNRIRADRDLAAELISTGVVR